MKNIIVTGASGFIGSDLITELQSDYNIVANGRKFKTKYASRNIKYLEGDINLMPPSKFIECLPSKVADIFIHAAGLAHTPQTDSTIDLFTKNNVYSTTNALLIAKKTKVKKFIYISSVSAINGDETDQYGKTKKESEIIVTDFCKENNIDFIIIRPVVVYGELDEKGNVAKLIRQIKKGFFPLFNNGNSIKSMIYVKNLSHFIKFAMENNEFKNRILIAKDKDDLTVKDICTTVKEELGKNSILFPVSISVVDFLIIVIRGFQKLGILKRLNVRSLRNLRTESNYELNDLNKYIINKLPYSTYDGLRNTVRNFK